MKLEYNYTMGHAGRELKPNDAETGHPSIRTGDIQQAYGFC
jgi:hypothetical protein